MRQIGKIVSLFIVLCMICSTVPMMTMAATDVSTFEELKSAFENGGEVTLTRDIVVTEGLKLSGTANLVINGGGHIISPAVTGLDELGVVNSDATAIEQIIRIYSGGKLTVNNATIYGGKGRCINNEGELVMNNVSLERAHLVGGSSGAGMRNNGKVSLTNCNIRRNGCDSNGGGFNNVLASSVMVFNNCSVVENRNFTSGMGGGAGESRGTLYINNSTFANNQSSEIGGGINNFGGTIYAMNSTFTGNVTTVGYAYYGGAIGINEGNFYAVNSVFAFNQSGAGISDIGLYDLDSTSKVELYNCAYTSVAGNSSNVAKVKTVDCKQISESDVPGDVFDGSRTTGILDKNGVEQSTTYDRPIIAPLGNGIYGVYLNKNSLLLNGGTDTYFSTGDFSAKMSYKDSNGDIVPLGDCEAAAEEDKVVKYPDGSNRTGNAIGAASDTDTHYTYYVVKVNPASNGTVEGGSAFGNALLEGTSITVKAVPDEGYRFAGWKIGTETSPSVTENPYTFTLSSDITLTPVFEQSTLLSLEITNVTDKTRTYGDTVSKDELTVKAVFNDSTVDENFKDYTITYEDSATFLKKGSNKIFVTADGITSAPYVINGVQGKMVMVSMFRITNPQLIYDGNEKIGLIKAAVSLKPEYEGKVGTPSYTVKKDGAVVTSVKDAGKYDIYAECEASDEYDAFSAEKLGAITVAQKALANSDFVMGANPVYDGSEKSAPVTTTLVKDTDYTVSGTEKLTNVSAADAEIIFTGCGNYRGEVKLSWNLEKAENTNVPPAVGVGVSYNKTDGKITGVDSTMEYSSDNTTWKAITGTEITGLASGTYYVRYKETDNYKASTPKAVTVSAYNNKDFSGISATGYSGRYDGAVHGITVTGVPEGATVTYSEDGTTFNFNNSYKNFTDGEKTVYYKVSMDGYNDFVGNAKVQIDKAILTIKIKPATKLVGTRDPQFEAESITGLIDESDLYSIVYKRGTGYTGIENVGADITITADCHASANYEVVVIEAKLTIIDKYITAAPTGVAAVNCTTSANDDGKITGVDSTMEYSSDNTTWNEITGTEITGLANGTYYVRYKETNTNKASDAVTVIVGAYSSSSSGRGGSRVSYVTVKFETNGGSKVESQSIKKNETVASVSAPTKEGYEFAGWYSDKELTKEFDFSAKITASMTVYAKWNEVKKDEPVEDNSKNEIIFTIGKKTATVFGASKSFDVSPLVRNERTMLPARFVAESLGASVEWNGAKKLVTVKGKHLKTGEEVTILITIGSDIAYINGAEYKLDTKAFAENNRTYTPLRFISEQLGATVEWKAETQQVIITK